MMNGKKPVGVFPLLAAAIFLLTGAAPSAQSKNQPKERRVRIITEEAFFDAEKEEVTIDGKVEIQMEDIVLRGNGLNYNRKEQTARFTNGPVQVESEKGITGIMGNVEVALEERTARAWGGCVFEMEDKEKVVRFEAEAITLDERKKLAVSKSGAEVHYREKPREKKEGEEEKSREFHFSSGAITFDYGAQKVVAGGTPRLEFEEGRLTAPEIRADLVKKVITANDVELALNDVAARAGNAVIYYTEDKAELAGGVTAERGGERLKADKIEIGYRKGKRYVHLHGKGQVDLLVGDDKKQ